MSEGISKQLVLPKGRGFGLRDGALDKDAFRKAIPVLAAKVPPEKAGLLLKAPALKRCVLFAQASTHAGHGLTTLFSRSLIDIARVKSVARGPNQERLVLLKYTHEGAIPLLVPHS